MKISIALTPTPLVSEPPRKMATSPGRGVSGNGMAFKEQTSLRRRRRTSACGSEPSTCGRKHRPSSRSERRDLHGRACRAGINVDVVVVRGVVALEAAREEDVQVGGAAGQGVPGLAQRAGEGGDDGRGAHEVEGLNRVNRRVGVGPSTRKEDVVRGRGDRNVESTRGEEAACDLGRDSGVGLGT